MNPNRVPQPLPVQTLNFANYILMAKLDLFQHEADLPFSNIEELPDSKKMKKTKKKRISQKSCDF